MWSSTQRRTQARPITILSLNVGKGAVNHEIALNEANLSSIDVLLIQEPFISNDRHRRITKKHPNYEAFSPIDDWTATRPRVITYVKKKMGIRSEQSQTNISGDLLHIKLFLNNGQSLNIFNVYNPPYPNEEYGPLEVLYSTAPHFFKSNCLLQGDFNLHHPYWQPSWRKSPSPAAEKFLNWTEENNFNLLSPLDKPTQNRGNVLDLAFGFGPLLSNARCNIAKNIECPSDHLPLLTTILCGKREESLSRLKLETLNTELFQRLLTTSITSISPIPTHPRPVDLDTLAEGITKAMHNAYSGAAQRSHGHGKGSPWWDLSCKLARQDYKSTIKALIVSSDELKEAKKNYRRIIKKAKNDFYRAKIEKASTSKEIFSITKWHKSTGIYRSTPLKDPTFPDNPPATTTAEKRQILIRNLLTNHSDAGDIPMDTPTVPRSAFSFPQISKEEIREAVLRAGNTAPGIDEVPTAIFKHGWPLIEPFVNTLFVECLRIGYHPTSFRRAVLVILQKPNKPDLTSPRSYRPIALLSVLGKGLERLLAKRIAWIAIREKVLTTQQFGALPCRSAVDLTTCLTHDVERALNRGRTASMLTIDVKGAFDSVLPGRLHRRLREQGWPDNLTKWVSSFTTKRTVQIRLDGDLGPVQNINCGLPQGSPISPILFMLYISPLFKTGQISRNFGYADDMAILAISNSLNENCISLSKTVKKVLEWGQIEGICFDSGKTELQHFSRRRLDKNPTNTPSVTWGNELVSENSLRPYTRWLGIYFDKSLSFKWHVQIRAGKAMKVVNALRSLGNTTRGAPPRLLRHAILACALPSALYGSETWWPGINRTTEQGNIVSNKVMGHLDILRKMILSSARAILPVYKTTPTPALLRESGLLPPDLELDKRSRKAALRTHCLDRRHPLRRRAELIERTRQSDSRFSRQILMLPDIEYIDPLICTPWTTKESWHAGIRRISNQSRSSINNIPFQDTSVYTDASIVETPSGRRVGAGFVIYQANHLINRSSIPLSPTLSIFDAEIQAASSAIEFALSLSSTRFSNDLWIILDNQEVARQLLKTPVCSSQDKFVQFASLASKWSSRPRLPHTLSGQVRIIWVPSHNGIQGNVQADLAAKDACNMTPDKSCQLSIASANKWAKDTAEAEINEYWLKNSPQSYLNLGISNFVRSPPELNLPRHLVAHVYAARSEHGDFAAYHDRFKHTNSTNTCSCTALKSPRHVLKCSFISKHLPKVPRSSAGDPAQYFFGTYKGAKELVKWLQATKFFSEICPRKKSP